MLNRITSSQKKMTVPVALPGAGTALAAPGHGEAALIDAATTLKVALAIILLSVNNEAFSHPAAGVSGKVYQSMAAVGHPSINLWLLLLGAVAIGSILCFMAFRPEKR